MDFNFFKAVVVRFRLLKIEKLPAAFWSNETHSDWAIFCRMAQLSEQYRINFILYPSSRHDTDTIQSHDLIKTKSETKNKILIY